jgi:hypothetical protein
LVGQHLVGDAKQPGPGVVPGWDLVEPAPGNDKDLRGGVPGIGTGRSPGAVGKDGAVMRRIQRLERRVPGRARAPLGGGKVRDDASRSLG